MGCTDRGEEIQRELAERRKGKIERVRGEEKIGVRERAGEEKKRWEGGRERK